jgi:hypothetical protein
LTSVGHLELHKVDPSQYVERWANVQRFLDEFYDGALDRPPHRRFDLRAEADGGDWSAHVFPAEQVAFFGFSSCYRNDRYWTGASFNPRSIERARRHLDEHARGFVTVAVWHHGFQSDQRRPDYLRIEDAGMLYNAGFRVGLHGHTHKAATTLLDELFREGFVAIGTGSLGAGPSERPDAAGNQFTVVDVHPGQVKTELFERDGYGTFAPKPPRLRLLGDRVEATRGPPYARTHRRVYHVDPTTGLAKSEVEIDGPCFEEDVTLALLVSPFTDARSVSARSGAGSLSVERAALRDGRIRFYTKPILPPSGRLQWRYEVSNAFALSRADRKLRPDLSEEMPNLPEDFDARGHVVRFACDRLTLRTEFPTGEAVIDESAAFALAERRFETNGETVWRLDEAEAARCRHAVGPSFAELTIDAPRVGYRYAVAYRLAQSGAALDSVATRFANRLAECCQDEDFDLSRRLEESVEVGLKIALGEGVERLRWLGLVWSQSDRRLLTSFGRFPSRLGGTRFACGTGVAGHAFRFNKVASWSRDAGRASSLIYQSCPEFNDRAVEHDWIVAVPLLVAPNGPSLGVISLNGDDTSLNAGATLADLALRLATEEPLAGDTIKLCDSLVENLNLAFWIASTKALELGPPGQRFAEQAIQAHGALVAEDTGPGLSGSPLTEAPVKPVK